MHSVCTTCVAAVHGGQKRALNPPGTAVLDSYELPFEFWEVNPGLLQEQSVLLTAELALHPPPCFCLYSPLSCCFNHGYAFLQYALFFFFSENLDSVTSESSLQGDRVIMAHFYH